MPGLLFGLAIRQAWVSCASPHTAQWAPGLPFPGVSAGRMPPAAGASGARVAVSSADMDDVEFVDDEGIEALNEVLLMMQSQEPRHGPCTRISGISCMLLTLSL